MKNIPLKTHPDADKPGPDNQPIPLDKRITTTSLIGEMLKMTPPGGFTFEEMEARRRIRRAMEKIAEGSTVLQLEDADYDHLLKLLPQSRWAITDDFLLEVRDDIKNATTS